MIHQTFVRCFSIVLMFALSINFANAQDPKIGEALFKDNCASCHSRDMKKDMTGPALAGVEERWSKFPKKELYDWIRNSSGVLASPNYKSYSYAKGLYASYNNTVMTPFPTLTDEDISSLLVYINNVATSGCAQPPCATAAADNKQAKADDKKGSGANSTILWVLAFVLLVATMLLARTISSMNRLAQQKSGELPEGEKSFFQLILNPTMVRLLVFALVVVGGYTTVDNVMGLSRQQNYEPQQPIKFSHALHAGKHGIDCQYCHDGARRSKHGIIPATNTCMNCHTAVQNGPEHGTAEILKIYASSGFNPISNKTPEYGQYFKSDVPVEKRLEIYKRWLKEANKDKKTVSDLEINSQLAAAKPLIGKPINWTKIHNLPDHVYFNHAQHVSVGKVACQDCHGKIEEMALVKQHAPLSMGWCVNCHRQTKVKFDENGYYNSKTNTHAMYERYHNEIKSGKRNAVTVEEIGGLECQKCHY
jgi:cytochrome c2